MSGEWRAVESTSATLRRTQEALAASQADLTRVEQERDEAIAAGDRIAMRLVDFSVQRDQARAELVTARAELEQLRAAMDASLNRRAD